MKKKKIKIMVSVLVLLLVGVSGVAYYLFNMPHRNIQEAKTDYSFSSSEIVNEYLADATIANEKYLEEEGDSKILAVTGKIFSIGKDQNNQKVILLKDTSEKAGVSCTFTEATNRSTKDLEIGQTVTIKGVIRSGAGFDADLDMYEDVIMEKCDVVNE
ncbi:tRNA_anti-like [Pricia antarctica]|uniref:tRNA_anti-like n=1 Tax=Pricia antarctica TaxID=641691 RepID=A0A1G7JAW1_9FLAO|nr:OB-fold putative lipoprotein [Pricia antarctica]SDF22070.1 tRNA_anti-like [Pricia antarctica]